jgi:hypothetical protein
MPLTCAELLSTLPPAGEVTCLNCGRLLAEVVHDRTSDTLKLQRLCDQSTVQVIVAGRQRFRCGHCNGHAYLTLEDQGMRERAGR